MIVCQMKKNESFIPKPAGRTSWVEGQKKKDIWEIYGISRKNQKGRIPITCEWSLPVKMCFPVSFIWSSFMMKLTEIYDAEKGWLSARNSSNSCLWVKSERFVRRDDFLWLTSSGEIVVDTFVLCKKVEGKIILFSCSVKPNRHLTNNGGLDRSLVWETWGISSVFPFTDFILSFPASIFWKKIKRVSRTLKTSFLTLITFNIM